MEAAGFRVKVPVGAPAAHHGGSAFVRGPGGTANVEGRKWKRPPPLQVVPARDGFPLRKWRGRRLKCWLTKALFLPSLVSGFPKWCYHCALAPKDKGPMGCACPIIDSRAEETTVVT